MSAWALCVEVEAVVLSEEEEVERAVVLFEHQMYFLCLTDFVKHYNALAHLNRTGSHEHKISLEIWH